MKKTATINLGKGNQVIAYAKVAARVAEIHRANKNISIRTDIEFKEGWVLAKAKVIPDVKNPEQFFTGTSLGKAGAEKALEKLETIAVGRALAFAGYLSDGEIASSEEMAKYEEAPKVENTKALEKIRSAKNKEALRLIWQGLSQAERDDKEVLALKETLKKSYENTSTGTKNTGLVSAPQGEGNRNGAKEDSGNKVS